MSATLLLRLAGPMQSWGDSSRFNHRGTRREPTKSGVIGLLAAAQGLRRTDSIEHLAALQFGVRVDQIGIVGEDFQTEIDWRNGNSKPLTHRDYLADAKFVAAVQGPNDLIELLASAVAAPAFPIYLGRRAFPPAGRVLLGVTEDPISEVLECTPWIASNWYRRKQPHQVHLPIVRDVGPAEKADEVIPDDPVSFDPRNRRHKMRGVIHGWVTISNAAGYEANGHDPLQLLGGR